LSRREEEVVGHMALGRTNPEIADLTGLSPETVKAYLKSAFGKLGVRNRVEAMRTLSNVAQPSATRLQRSQQKGSALAATPALTPGEVEVLRETATGKTNAEIALATGLSRNTVKTYLQIAFRKLEVRNRIEAIAKAEEYGLLG
jgi:DNA-binding CsgD family transcriptional regulator